MSMQEFEEDTWESLIEDGHRAFLNGSWAEAKGLYKAAFAIAEQKQIIVNDYLTKLFTLLADIYVEKKHYKQAESNYRKALVLGETSNCEKSLEHCIILKRLSEVCRLQGKFKDAAQANGLAELSLMPKRERLAQLYKNAATNSQ